MEIIRSTDIEQVWWQHKLNEIGQIVVDAEDLHQCIRTIIKTPQGSVPHLPTFASKVWNYIDYPIPKATPYIIRESIRAITTWEPRVTVKSVEVSPYVEGISTIAVNVIWQIVGSTFTDQTQVILDGQ